MPPILDDIVSAASHAPTANEGHNLAAAAHSMEPAAHVGPPAVANTVGKLQDTTVAPTSNLRKGLIIGGTAIAGVAAGGTIVGLAVS